VLDSASVDARFGARPTSPPAVARPPLVPPPQVNL
jgi:hypothetical protein